jgi:hypothetical protein
VQLVASVGTVHAKVVPVLLVPEAETVNEPGALLQVLLLHAVGRLQGSPVPVPPLLDDGIFPSVQKAAV